MKILNELREGFGITWSSIWANRMRSALATLGIIIGILTVALMATAIEGLKQSFLRSISGLGADVLYIEKFPWESPGAWWKVRTRRDFDISYVKAIQRESKYAIGVSVEASGNCKVQYQDRSASTVWLAGNNEESAMVRQLNVKEGRFLSASEVQGGRPVCVMGADVASRLFPRESGVGKKIKIDQKTYEVVGVLDKFGQFLFANMDFQIIIPITRFMSDFDRRPYLFMMVKVRDPKMLDEAKEEIRGIMRKARRVPPGAEDDFAINQQEIVVNQFNRIGGVIAGVGLFITSLSLFVGGIGIMNIMFVSVTERTREIGIRKAIGAKRRAILIQFLLEAAIICLFGGLVGLALGYAVTIALNKYLPATLPLSIAILGVAVSLVTGLISGFMPAWRAARMNPVDALRAE